MENVNEIELLTRYSKSEINDNKILAIVELLLCSINDWPNEIKSLNDFEKEIEKFVKGKVNYYNVKEALNNINYSNDAWYAESLSQILDIFPYFRENVTLTEIFKEVLSNVLIGNKSN
jgi:hypothetical protein